MGQSVRYSLHVKRFPPLKTWGHGETIVSKPLKGFITYSHKDAEQKDELRERLAVMEQQNELVIWSDCQLTPGDEV